MSISTSPVARISPAKRCRTRSGAGLAVGAAVGALGEVQVDQRQALQIGQQLREVAIVRKHHADGQRLRPLSAQLVPLRPAQQQAGPMRMTGASAGASVPAVVAGIDEGEGVAWSCRDRFLVPRPGRIGGRLERLDADAAERCR